MPSAAINKASDEDWTSKVFRNRCVTRLEGVMVQNAENTLVKHFEGDPRRAEKYYFEMARACGKPQNARSHYMRSITRALKHFKGPGPIFCPVSGGTPNEALLNPSSNIGQNDMESDCEASWPSRMLRDSTIIQLQTEFGKDPETASRLNLPLDAKQTEAVIFLLCDDNKETYMKLVTQFIESFINESNSSHHAIDTTEPKNGN